MVFFETEEFTKEERLKIYYIANMDYSYRELAPDLYSYQVVYYTGGNAVSRLLS